MKFTFDNNKDAINIEKHNLSLVDASELDWANMLSWVDDRQDYGEVRQIGANETKTLCCGVCG